MRSFSTPHSSLISSLCLLLRAEQADVGSPDHYLVTGCFGRFDQRPAACSTALLCRGGWFARNAPVGVCVTVVFAGKADVEVSKCVRSHVTLAGHDVLTSAPASHLPLAGINPQPHPFFECEQPWNGSLLCLAALLLELRQWFGVIDAHSSGRSGGLGFAGWLGKFTRNGDA